MAYTEFVNRLSTLTGLNVDVLNAWASRENGVNNNILGVTSGGSLVKYPSQTAAAEATARLIQSSPNYAGIRASESGTSQQQALAIAQSPWRLGGTGIKLAGGTDPYYYKGFVEAGILAGNTSKPGGGVSTPLTNTGAGILADFQARLNEIGVNSDPTHVLSHADAVLIVSKLYHLNVGDGTDPSIKAQLQHWEGKTVSDAFGGGAPFDTSAQATANTLGLPNFDVPGALMFVAVILVGITFLILGGIIGLRKK